MYPSIHPSFHSFYFWAASVRFLKVRFILNLPKYMRSQKHARARALAHNSITTIAHKLNFLPRASCQPPSCHTKKIKLAAHALAQLVHSSKGRFGLGKYSSSAS